MKRNVYLQLSSEKKTVTRLSRSAEIEKLISMTSDTTIINGLRALEKKLSTDWVSEKKPETKERHYQIRLAHEYSKQAKTKADAVKAWNTWTSDDERLVIESSETDAELAIRLGRSLWAVKSKRRKLYRRKLDFLETQKGRS